MPMLPVKVSPAALAFFAARPAASLPHERSGDIGSETADASQDGRGHPALAIKVPLAA
ncbi:UNVERIFIED_CONTAM: hypothetical protein Sradi_1633200 [Sesamum radiatum]|uniref:Uncharacterized protein n=1 Tax=Sesamum radiatum TaxID=300843 RepID=A0AAW2UDC3_SESRA